MTEQIRENLLLNGEPVFMFNFPNIPRDHPRILHEFHLEPALDRASIVYSYIGSTACWRRYIGTWEVRDGQFFLKKVFGQYKIDGPEPVPATWFSGTLRLPQGKILDHDPWTSLESIYEKEIRIRIRKGRVVDESVRVNCCGFFRRVFSRIPIIGRFLLKP
jgi:hypothetical protein